MTQASEPSRAGSTSSAKPRSPLWLGPLMAGLGFGFAYGITHRLVDVNVGDLIRFGQGFDVQVFPGTSLESLRLQFGADADQLRGNLDLDQIEREAAASKDPAAAVPSPVDAEPDEAVPDDPSLEPTPEEAPGVQAESSPAPAPPPPPALPRP